MTAIIENEECYKRRVEIVRSKTSFASASQSLTYHSSRRKLRHLCMLSASLKAQVNLGIISWHLEEKVQEFSYDSNPGKVLAI